MKKLILIFTSAILLLSCQKEVFKPETPYVCTVTSVGMESDVFVNGKKEKLDSVVENNFQGINQKYYYYSFRVHQGDMLEASLKGNESITSFDGFNNVSLGVGMYFVGKFESWKQLYYILITDYGNGYSECFNFTCPFYDSDGDGIYDGSGYFENATIKKFTYNF